MTEIPRTKFTEHQFTAFIGHYLSFANYLQSYKAAFDILMTKVAEGSGHVDEVAYPILFIARHCMELGLKANIRYFSKYSGRDDYTKNGGHNLENLFDAFKMHVTETFKNLKANYGIEVDKEDVKSFNDLCLEVEKLKTTLHALDKNSDAFRYPVDKDQKSSFENQDKINLIDVNDLLEKSILLFMHTANVFAKYTDYADTIEQYYEDLMRDQY